MMIEADFIEVRLNNLLSKLKCYVQLTLKYLVCLQCGGIKEVVLVYIVEMWH